jgi:hypothetical protein
METVEFPVNGFTPAMFGDLRDPTPEQIAQRANEILHTMKSTSKEHVTENLFGDAVHEKEVF